MQPCQKLFRRRRLPVGWQLPIFLVFAVVNELYEFSLGSTGPLNSMGNTLDSGIAGNSVPSHQKKSIGVLVPDHFPTLNEAFQAAGSPDVITLREGDHQIGEHLIKGGLFHGNEPKHFRPEIEVNKKLLIQGDLAGSEKPLLKGKIVLQQPVDIETWKPEEGGGTLQLMRIWYQEPTIHDFCLFVEGGAWLVEECEIRCTGDFSKAVWCCGGRYVFDDSYRGGGKIVDHFPGPEAHMRRCTLGGLTDSSSLSGWGVMCWQLSQVCIEDCLIENTEYIGISACHASVVEVSGCTIQGCKIGGLMVDEEAKMTVQACLIKDNKSAFVAGNEAHLAVMEIYDSVIHGRPWHDAWGGEIIEADREVDYGDGLPMFLGTWTDRGRIPDPDPTDVERYVRRVRKNTWSMQPVRISRADAEQMGLDPPKKTITRIVGRPGKLEETANQYEGGPELVSLVGIGLRLNVTHRGEVVVMGLLVGMPAQVGGVEVGDVVTSVDGFPVWLPEHVMRRCAGEPGTPVTLVRGRGGGRRGEGKRRGEEREGRGEGKRCSIGRCERILIEVEGCMSP
eukprot:767912-Hanusia_phi.AAC.6